ncbi:very low-density lipoprotein receptor-like [Macrobrachium nipponense]|uniref:very low-density lipoprotein receptor-like n=1 Tax=Macrobrachium nipponense TaxID=159736 RepID=UPI0030C898C6
MELTAFLLLVCLGLTSAIDCLPREISCNNDTQCISQRDICDGIPDCADGSDEYDDVCQAWKHDCRKDFVSCSRNHITRCIEIADYCVAESPICEGSLDRRLCTVLKNHRLKKLQNVLLVHRVESALGPLTNPSRPSSHGLFGIFGLPTPRLPGSQ